MVGAVAVCAIYPSEEVMLIGPWRDDRPRECGQHRLPFRVCPVGLDVLGISTDDIGQRAEECRRTR